MAYMCDYSLKFYIIFNISMVGRVMGETAAQCCVREGERRSVIRTGKSIDKLTLDPECNKSFAVGPRASNCTSGREDCGDHTNDLGAPGDGDGEHLGRPSLRRDEQVPASLERACMCSDMMVLL